MRLTGFGPVLFRVSFVIGAFRKWQEADGSRLALVFYPRRLRHIFLTFLWLTFCGVLASIARALLALPLSTILIEVNDFAHMPINPLGCGSVDTKPPRYLHRHPDLPL